MLLRYWLSFVFVHIRFPGLFLLIRLTLSPSFLVHQQEELNRTRDSSAYSIAALEKSLRAARKENYKLQSAWVKGQEELKVSRASYRATRSDLDAEKQKLDQREQETFAAQYKLIGTQEALTSTQERLRVLEAERDALKTSLKEEEVARVAAEGRIALPAPARRRGGLNASGEDEEEEEEEDDIDFATGYDTRHGIFMSATSPSKSPSKRARVVAAAVTMDATDPEDAGSDKENASVPSRHNHYIKSSSHPNLPLVQGQQNRQQQRQPRHLQQHYHNQSGQYQLDYLRLESEVASERARREQAEETIEFLKMECQFRCCSCRVAEEKEREYIYDGSMAEGMDAVRREATQAGDIELDAEMDADIGGSKDVVAEDGASGADAIAGIEAPVMPSGAVSVLDHKEDYFSLVSAGDDSRMLDKSGIVPEEVDGNRNDGVVETAPAVPTVAAAAAALCFSPTSGTFRSASAASSSAGAGSAPTTAAPTADTSFDSDQSNYATPPVTTDRPSSSRVLPFKPLLDTIPSQSASPCQGGLVAQRANERNEQEAKIRDAGTVDDDREMQPQKPNSLFSDLRNQSGDAHKAREDFYTPAEEIDLMDVEDTFCDNDNDNNNNEDNDEFTNLEAENQSPVTNSPQTPLPRRFMVRTVTTTKQVPLQSTPVTNRDDNKVTTPHHHNLQHRHDHKQSGHHQLHHPSTTGPRPRSQYTRHHNEQQPPTPMTAPPPTTSGTGTGPGTSTSTELDQLNPCHHHHQEYHHHHTQPIGKHTPIDRAAALAQIQARRGRARSLAEGQQHQQQQQHQHQHQHQQQHGASASGTTTSTSRQAGTGADMATPGRNGTSGFGTAIGTAIGTGSRSMKRDVRDVSAPALRGRGF